MPATKQGQRKGMDKSMKTIKVSAAIIKHGHSIFATQRGYGVQKGKWEFPGGKIEPGESPEQAVVREIREELAMEIVVQKLLTIVEHDYPDFHLQMYCFLCEICEMKEGRPVLREHEAARWLTGKTIDEVDWLPADQVVLHLVKELMA